MNNMASLRTFLSSCHIDSKTGGLEGLKPYRQVNDKINIITNLINCTSHNVRSALMVVVKMVFFSLWDLRTFIRILKKSVFK